MPTCQQEIQSIIDAGEVSSIAQLVPYIPLEIAIGIGINQLFKFDIIDYETATFIINLEPLFPPTSVGVTVTFYQYNDDETFTDLGSAYISELYMTFQKDFSEGTYFICISSQFFTYGGTFQGDFAAFPVTVKFRPEAFTGTNARAELFITQPERECAIPLYYEIVDGELPEGLTMNILGNIEGILPNLDCIEYTEDLSPSQNWYFKFGGQWEPWGLQWRFKIRLWPLGFEGNAVEEWFCIRVHNNWSWDKDNFIDHAPFTKTVRVKIQDEQIGTPLPDDICPECSDDEPELFTPQPIEFESPCDCETETTEEARQVLLFLQWYQSVVNNPDNSSEVDEFVENFRQSPQFEELMEKAGLGDLLLTTQELEERSLALIISSYEEALDDNGRNLDDIDAIMIRLRDEENQKLPMTLLSATGSKLLCDLEGGYSAT